MRVQSLFGKKHTFQKPDTKLLLLTCADAAADEGIEVLLMSSPSRRSSSPLSGDGRGGVAAPMAMFCWGSLTAISACRAYSLIPIRPKLC